MTDYSELVKFLRGLSPWAFPDASNKRMFDAADAIEALQAEVPKRGKWIDDEFGAKCSYCGKYAYWSKYEIPWESPYCPLCGAKMEVQDGE